MQVLNSGLDIHPSNYNKPTPKWVKIIADACFAIGAIGEIAMPEFEGKQWVIFGLLALKGVSKFITDHIE